MLLFPDISKNNTRPVHMVIPASENPLYGRPLVERLFCVRNGSATPREEGCAKQTQVMLLGKWSADDVASRLVETDVILEPWPRRYTRKTVPQIYGLIS